jgi:hypothetical protein
MAVHTAARKAKGYKGLEAGYRKELIRKDFDAKGPEAALARARKLKIKEGTVRTWMSRWRVEAGGGHAQISIRDLQKMSGETIGALDGPTPIKSGDRTVGLLIPLRATDPDRLAAVLLRAEALAKGRDPGKDDAALAGFGEVDPVDWSVEAVRGLTAPRPRK